MNWLPNKRSRNLRVGGKNYIDRLIIKTASQVIKLTICLVGTGMFLSGDAASLKLNSWTSVSSRELALKINQIATEISVKILDRDFLGSGFIVQQIGQKYLVITNQHVLRAGEAPYTIEAPDGNTYLAKVVSDITDNYFDYDLAILEFEANQIYPTAKIGSSLFLKVGEPIFAAGFPYRQSTVQKNPSLWEQTQTNTSRGLSIKQGRIAIILNQALEEGYQIGYTNDVKKGMSGGPLLNSQGEVVGINGKHAYPLWESPEVYQDGSEPCPALQELIIRSSLAIPIEKSIELKPQLKSLDSVSNYGTVPKSNLLTKNSHLIAKMQAEARETQRKCQDYLIESVRNRGRDTAQ
ncbi:MAG: serine protease [Cyanobacteria bacterium P01_A01_bin.40]